jgi:hypothetical protein
VALKRIDAANVVISNANASESSIIHHGKTNETEEVLAQTASQTTLQTNPTSAGYYTSKVGRCTTAAAGSNPRNNARGLHGSKLVINHI